MNKSIICLLFALAGCELMPTRTVEVPVTRSCVTTIPDKPQRLTPCPHGTGAVECIHRKDADIVALQAAVDGLTDLLRACGR
jgi:hypothetical protein